ncbi:MAG TPA: cytochrome c-type biogenesis protein [Albitalea sp.]|nr:cytochrome c-type biogenesis protein [Albitalea sp.]
MKWLSMLLLALSMFGAQAKEAAPLADDQAVEARLVGIAEDLRCLVCQNESLAGSRADLAEDLRREIRSLIRQGKTDQEVIDFLVSRYGDFVRYRPPFKPTTWLLWGGPFVFLVAGLGALTMFLRRRPRQDTPLSPEEEQEAAKLLAADKT